jgi:UPF0755 protein
VSPMFLRAAKAALVASLVLLPAFTGWLVRECTAPSGGPGTSVFFEVEKGRSVRAVAAGLHDQKVIRSPLALTLAYDLFYSRERLKAGEYELTFPASAKAVLFRMFRGRVYLRPLTIPEGLTGNEIAELLRAQGAGDSGSFRTAFRETARVAEWDNTARDLEGYLFPDTYLLPRKATAGDIVEAMTGQFRRVFHEGWRKRADELGLSVRDVVILASLIEKETALPAERPLVSAVFHNRLRIGMKLDCDPTVIYGLKLEDKYSGRLLSRDLKFPSPFNTYIHAGVPPGPICNPGRLSLEAALYPAPDNYLYFVARGDGSHSFSRTFSDHAQAVEKYHLKKK